MDIHNFLNHPYYIIAMLKIFLLLFLIMYSLFFVYKLKKLIADKEWTLFRSNIVRFNSNAFATLIFLIGSIVFTFVLNSFSSCAAIDFIEHSLVRRVVIVSLAIGCIFSCLYLWSFTSYCLKILSNVKKANRNNREEQ